MTSSSAIALLDYDRLRDALASVGVVVAPEEVHGAVCGALCAGGPAAAERWLADSLEDQEVLDESVDLGTDLGDLVDASAKMLAGDDLGFEPLLPDDAAPLAERVQALALWCHGFLAGLGATLPRIGRQGGAADTDLNEILADFGEISRAGLSEEEAADAAQADFALAEVHEHVRVSVQLVYEQLAAQRAAAADLH